LSATPIVGLPFRVAWSGTFCSNAFRKFPSQSRKSDKLENHPPLQAGFFSSVALRAAQRDQCV
jgi:hypothetical protein